VGKVQELSLGFAGGVGAFAAMGKAYGIVVPEWQAQEYVNAWRAANPWAPWYWGQLERAYMRVMRTPGLEVQAGVVTYMFDGTHLWCMLLSGRVLCYPFARLDEDGVSYAKCSWKPKADAKEWPRGRLWKGLACENITQAIANDLLREALRELDGRGVPVVMHVHDEIICEVAERDGDKTANILFEVMTKSPSWALGLPLAIGKPIVSKCYGK
jgi:DNA polymerase